MVYYAIIFASYLILIIAPHIFSSLLLSGLVLLSSAAFLFSLYLLFVQGFLLRQWCIWCLLSATLSIAIFIVSLISIDVAVTFLMGAGTAIWIIHELGFVLGMGGATAALFLFSKFIGDSKIDGNELRALKGMSELIWLGLALAFVSQLAAYVVNAEALSRSGSFVMQSIALFVAAFGGAVLMIIFAPVLEMISFGENTKEQTPSPLKALRRPLFLIGAITLASWYFAFALNFISLSNLASLLFAYLFTLIITVAFALLWENRLSKS